MARAHELNHPHIPVLRLRMHNTAETLQALSEYLPRKFWHRAWIHASNSCKISSSANFGKRDIEKGIIDTSWAIALMQRIAPAVWTLENVADLYDAFRGMYPTARVVEMSRFCRLAQSRKRLILSSVSLDLRELQVQPLTMRELLGEEMKWEEQKSYFVRNSFAAVRSVDKPS